MDAPEIRPGATLNEINCFIFSIASDPQILYKELRDKTSTYIHTY